MKSELNEKMKTLTRVGEGGTKAEGGRSIHTRPPTVTQRRRGNAKR